DARGPGVAAGVVPGGIACELVNEPSRCHRGAVGLEAEEGLVPAVRQFRKPEPEESVWLDRMLPAEASPGEFDTLFLGRQRKRDPKGTYHEPGGNIVVTGSPPEVHLGGGGGAAGRGIGARRVRVRSKPPEGPGVK